LGGGSR